MLAISGRNRKPQLALAKEFGIKDFPTPGGGCLLTDPGFARKLRDFLKHSKSLSWDDVSLLRVGRHFRIGKDKIIVGRRHEENLALKKIAQKQKLPWMEVRGFMGPVTVVQGKSKSVIEKAAGLTVRYSDAPKNSAVKVVLHKGNKKTSLEAKATPEEDIERIRV